MTFKLVLFILVELTALIYFIEVLRRVSKRAREYELKDTKDTIPFGFVRLRHIVIIYIVTYLVWLVFSFVLYFYFIGGGITRLEIGKPSRSTDVILDL